MDVSQDGDLIEKEISVPNIIAPEDLFGSDDDDDDDDED